MTHSPRHRLVALLAATLTVAACSSGDAFEPAPMPEAALDNAVTELLPIGPHRMDLRFVIGTDEDSSEMTVTGYLDLPPDHDLAAACSYDLTATWKNSTGSESTYVFRKAEVGPSWRRVEASTNTAESQYIGQWFDGADPTGPEPFILLPPLLLSGIGSVTEFCNLRRIDQITVLADRATGRLTWSSRDFEAVLDASNDRWIVELLTAAGFTGADLNERAAQLSTVSEATFDSTLMNTELWIDGDGTFTLYARNDGSPEPTLTIAFTPTEKQDVENVTGTPTYFESIAGSTDPESFLDDLG